MLLTSAPCSRPRHWRRALGLVLLLVLFVQSSVLLAQDDVPREETLIMGVLGGIGPNPRQANPFLYSTNVGAGYQQLMIESLFYLNLESGEVEPWLATGYEWNDDFTELTISLREGVTWSDGEAFNADDVVFTLNMLKEYAPALWNSGDIGQYVDEVTAVDEHTVRLTLNQSLPRFIWNFAILIYNSVAIVPEHIWADVDPNTFTNFDLEQGYPVFTGPYRVVSADETQIIFDRRDDWWGAEIGFHDLPAPRRVVMVNTGPEERAAAALQANEIDIVPQMSVGTFEAVRAANPNVIAWQEADPYGWFDICPHRLAINAMAEPWDNVEMRRALNLAINTEAYADVVTEGHGVEARWLFPPFPPLEAFLDENQDLLDQYEIGVYDPERAIELFESQGYTNQGGRLIGPDGQQLTIDLLTQTAESGGAEWGLATTFLIDSLSAVGIAVNPTIVDFSVFEPSGREGLYDIRVLWTCGSVIDPLGTLGNYDIEDIRPIGEASTGDNDNTERWANEEYSAIVDQISLLEPGDPQINELFREAFGLWLEGMPAIPLKQTVWIVPFNTTYWTNYPTMENNYNIPAVWWQTALQVVMNIEPAQ